MMSLNTKKSVPDEISGKVKILLAFYSFAEVIKYVKLPVSTIQHLINHPNYLTYKIPKKKGGYRDIFAPDTELKFVQTLLNELLQAYYFLIKPSVVNGFVINPLKDVRSCNILANASPHAGKKYVLNVDLKDFFPSISAKRILELLMSPVFKYEEHLATAITLLLTYKGQLPIGAPSSPVLSNFICLQLDKALIAYAQDNQLIYTRYADDLTFSSDCLISEVHLQELTKLIEGNDFKVNNKKVRLSTSSSKQTVTGLTVNEKPNVDRKLLKKIRAMLHDLTTNGLLRASMHHFKAKKSISEAAQTKFMNKLEGYINFVGQIRGKEDALYHRYKTDFRKQVVLMRSII
jgi:RNA-directed DNA polymerase